MTSARKPPRSRDRRQGEDDLCRERAGRPDSERVIRELATGGNGIIFTTSFGFMNPTIKVAKQFPKVKFEHCTGYKRADQCRDLQHPLLRRPLCPGRDRRQDVEVGRRRLYRLGADPGGGDGHERLHAGHAQRSIPRARSGLVWINGWYDPGKESDAAKALIDQGADVDRPAHRFRRTAPGRRAARGAWLRPGVRHDQVAPKAQLTSSVDHWDEYYTQRIQAAMDGSWATQDIWAASRPACCIWRPGPTCPTMSPRPPRRPRTNQERQHRDLQGAVERPERQDQGSDDAQLTDDDILGMNWLAEGIEGTLPQYEQPLGA